MSRGLASILPDVLASVNDGHYNVPDRRKRDPVSLVSRIRACGPEGPFPLIAECKPRAPSYQKAAKVRPEDALALYLRSRLAGVSILTEPKHFGGSLDALSGAHETTASPRSDAVPLLMKDFLLLPDQVQAGYRSGADAALVIVKAFDGGWQDARLDTVLREIKKTGMEALVEVASEKEYLVALHRKLPLVGINNRDLWSMRLDVGLAARLLRDYGKTGAVVAMSGYDTAEQMAGAISAGADAVLVGTSLMMADDPGALLKEACAKTGRAVPHAAANAG